MILRTGIPRPGPWPTTWTSGCCSTRADGSGCRSPSPRSSWVWPPRCILAIGVRAVLLPWSEGARTASFQGLLSGSGSGSDSGPPPPAGALADAGPAQAAERAAGRSLVPGCGPFRRRPADRQPKLEALSSCHLLLRAVDQSRQPSRTEERRRGRRLRAEAVRVLPGRSGSPGQGAGRRDGLLVGSSEALRRMSSRPFDRARVTG